MKHLQDFINGYFEAIFFAESATDCNGEVIEHIDEYSFSSDAEEECKMDCARFLDTAGVLVSKAIANGNDYGYTEAGHDFWFTRQGHGVGFWDRGLDEVGDQLTKVSKLFGERNIYINENNELGVE